MAFHFLNYSFIRIHKTLKVTPAMAAGTTEQLWEAADMGDSRGLGGIAMKQRHHQTQWAAQFAVASELCRRGYQVALTLGNHPTVDLMVVSPDDTPFFVDVKGQYRNNFWPIKPKEKKQKDLFYILAFVPDPKEGENRFYILTQAEADAGAAEAMAAYIARKPQERADKPDPMPGVWPEYARKHENCWNKLPT